MFNKIIKLFEANNVGTPLILGMDRSNLSKVVHG